MTLDELTSTCNLLSETAQSFADVNEGELHKPQMVSFVMTLASRYLILYAQSLNSGMSNNQAVLSTINNDSDLMDDKQVLLELLELNAEIV